MAAHDPRLWETLLDLSQNLATWTTSHAFTANRKLESGLVISSKELDFALTKAGKDSDFILKTEQKSVEAVVC